MAFFRSLISRAHDQFLSVPCNNQQSCQLHRKDSRQVGSYCQGKSKHLYLNSLITGNKISKQKIYDILVKYMKRSALSNLSFLRANAPQVLHPRLPHVLKHYLVGVTLEGLTQRQLVKRMEEMTNPLPPRRPRSGSVSRRRPRTGTSTERGRGHGGIARASSDQICYVCSRPTI